jgi:mono/diheme cytochrome c family protein
MRILLFIAVVGLVAGCRGGESEKPPVHLIQNMMTQEKGRPYRADKSGIFADGRMMRTPVEGTVAVGQLDEDDLYYEGRSTDGGFSQFFPPETKGDPKDDHVTDAVRARGENRYNIYCTPCHGREGDGKGPVALRGLEIPPANFHDPLKTKMFAGQIYSAIRNGVNNGNMPSYAAQIPVADRWAIVSYVRKLQGVGDEGGEAAMVLGPDPKVASAAYGKLVYQGKICITCHTLDGNKLVGPTWKGLYGKKEQTSAGEVTVDDAYLKESITQPMAKIVTGYPPAMPPQQLTDIQVDSLILFIKEQK